MIAASAITGFVFVHFDHDHIRAERSGRQPEQKNGVQRRLVKIDSEASGGSGHMSFEEEVG